MFIILFIILLSIIIYYLKKYNDALKNLKFILLVILTLVMVFNIILFPKEIIGATKKGIMIWFNSVLPSLLPFFIGVELLIGLGIVKFIGVLIEPIIRPIFNVPGEASFIFAMSITSGYPMGVKITSDLRNRGIINKIEAQRILAFCSTSGPLFMIGAVAIGMFNNLQIGPYMAIAHYLSAISVGIIFRFYGRKENLNRSLERGVRPSTKQNIALVAFKEMLYAKKKDGRSFGQLLGDSVKESINTIVMVGGFIVLFSVIMEEVTLLGILNQIYYIINKIGMSAIIPNELIEAVFTGFIEITMGCHVTSKMIVLSPIIQITLATMIISWSGLSIHAQSASILSSTDINMKIYIFSKLLHSIISGIYIYIILIFIDFKALEDIKTVFSHSYIKLTQLKWLDVFIFSSNIFIVMVTSLILLGILQITLNKLFNRS